MRMAFTRRGFLGSVAALMAAAAAPTSLAAGRLPFVEQGEAVDSLVWHLWDRERAPCGPLYVHEIRPWDGVGYPIVLRKSGYGRAQELYDGWYDFEWSNLRRDVPPQFWGRPGSDRYPNVHAYVREKRFGEHPEIMRRTMERNRLSGDRLFPVRRERKPYAQCGWNGQSRAYEVI